MKNLILIGGTMGAGKTTTSKRLQKLLPDCVFLDGDWCWDADPFVVTDETKRMVEGNIAFQLSSFLRCSAYKNVIFCWVMHEQHIIDDLLALLTCRDYRLFSYSLVLSPVALSRRIRGDVANGDRQEDHTLRSAARLPLYDALDTVKIDTSNLTPVQAAEKILRDIYPKFFLEPL